MPRFLKIWLFSALVSFTALGMWKGLEWYYSRGLEDEAPIVINALDLAKAYELDASSAINTYNGKQVIVTGIVTNKGESGDHYTVVLNGNFYDVSLVFTDLDEIEKLDGINNGDSMSVAGEISGFNIIYIQVIDCAIE